MDLKNLIECTSRYYVPCFIKGPMYSGKTTTLGKIVDTRRSQGKTCILVKSKKDTRSKAGRVSTHDDAHFEAVEVTTLADLDAMMCKADVFAIDEGHFFPDLAEFCRKMIGAKKEVYCAALNSSWKRLPFDNVTEACALTTNIRYRESVCEGCGEKAFYSRRIVEDERDILSGGKETYAAVCNDCFEISSSVMMTLLDGRRDLIAKGEISITTVGQGLVL
jgi:thymidine kinase